VKIPDPVSPGCEGVDLAIGQTVPWPTNEWTVRSPDEMGMDSEVVEAAFEYAFRPEHHTQALIVIRGGAIVAERYGEGADEGSYAASWGVARSFTSALIGIAIDEGLIEDVKVPMTTFFPEWIGTDKAPITLRSVLWMQSGIDYLSGVEPSLLPEEDMTCGLSHDVLSASRNNPVESPPDTTWFYSNGDTELLDGVISAATG